ncbi:PQQ-dependent sugar dehydrogenase [Patescibacteria group bacterium]|nr:PQQ-dependent sugar dehydrogenase [Patescibacteria group bacterium]
MKKILLFFGVIFILGGIIWAALFYWQNLRGIGPAIQPAPEDIADLIEEIKKERKNEAHKQGENTTDFPLTLPEGFSISIFARDIGPARVMTFDPVGNLLVSVTKENKVIALPDQNRDGVADEIITVIAGLNQPHGLAFRCERGCRLYIAETDQVAVYDYNAATLKALNKTILFDLPGGGNHFSRTIIFSEDGRLLTSVGSTCNVCNESDWRRAAILVSNADGSDLKVFASGLRNAVFMVLHPFIEQLWVTEMGRDLIGDDIPPDEINIVEEGKNYGWPICYGKNVVDTDFHKDDHVHIGLDCTEPFEIPSHIDLQAHSAPLGLAFVPGQGWPVEYRGDLLVSYHGSWNRTVPTGYKIMRFRLDEQGNYLSREDFISGWLTQSDNSFLGGLAVTERALGRPVDILIHPDGVMYVSDDKAGVIYRIVYLGQSK